MMPTVMALAPRTTVINTGSKLWIISEEISINMLTKPRSHTVRGIRAGFCMEASGIMKSDKFDAALYQIRA
jgi:hypothetical protein